MCHVASVLSDDGIGVDAKSGEVPRASTWAFPLPMERFVSPAPGDRRAISWGDIEVRSHMMAKATAVAARGGVPLSFFRGSIRREASRGDGIARKHIERVTVNAAGGQQCVIGHEGSWRYRLYQMEGLWQMVFLASKGRLPNRVQVQRSQMGLRRPLVVFTGDHRTGPQRKLSRTDTSCGSVRRPPDVSVKGHMSAAMCAVAVVDDRHAITPSRSIRWRTSRLHGSAKLQEQFTSSVGWQTSPAMTVPSTVSICMPTTSP